MRSRPNLTRTHTRPCSPCTGLPLRPAQWVPNLALVAVIEEWLSAHGLDHEGADRLLLAARGQQCSSRQAGSVAIQSGYTVPAAPQEPNGGSSSGSSSSSSSSSSSARETVAAAGEGGVHGQDAALLLQSYTIGYDRPYSSGGSEMASDCSEEGSSQCCESLDVWWAAPGGGGQCAEEGEGSEGEEAVGAEGKPLGFTAINCASEEEEEPEGEEGEGTGVEGEGELEEVTTRVLDWYYGYEEEGESEEYEAETEDEDDSSCEDGSDEDELGACCGLLGRWEVPTRRLRRRS